MNRLLPALCLSLLAACAAAPLPSGPHLAGGEKLALTQSGGGPEVAAVVSAFYGPSFDPAAFADQLAAAFTKYPNNPDLHEVAAYFASLRGDADLAELHHLRSALDLGAKAPVLSVRALNPAHPLAEEGCRLLATQHPDPLVRSAAQWVLLHAARLHGDQAAAERALRSLGVLDHWSLIGAFDNDEGKGLLPPYPPEQGLAPGVTVPGVLVPIGWRPVPQVGPLGDVPLESLVWPNRNAVAYLQTFVNLPHPQDALLWLSSDSPLRVFVNGQLSLSRETVTASGPDNAVLALHLAEGPNQILIKSANKGSTWGVTARLTGSDQRPLAGLTAQTEPPSDWKSRSFPRSSSSPPELAWVRGELEPSRAAFLGGELAQSQGDPQEAVRQLSHFQEAAPTNLLATLALGRASQINDEQGKALDLFNAGVKRGGQQVPAFYVDRARAYVTKGLFDKAQLDAEAFLKARPHDLEGQLLLASVQGHRNFTPERCRTLAEALADHPAELRPLRELAECRRSQGRLEEAGQLLARAQALGPGSFDTRQAALELAKQGWQLSAAREQARQLHDLYPLNGRVLLEVGQLAEWAGDEAAARRAYQGATALNPDLPSPLAGLAELEYRHGDDAEATRHWAAALERDPGDGLLSDRLENLQPTRLGFIEKFVPSDDEIDAAVSSGARTPAAEGSHEVILLDEEVTEVHADGSATRVVTNVSRAVNDQGRDQLTQFRVPTSGRLKVLKAYALSKSGDRQEAASVRGGAIRFRNLAVGSTAVVQYVHYAPNGHFLPNEFAAEWWFQSATREHRSSRWTLVLPKDRPLHVQVSGPITRTEIPDPTWAIHQFEAREVAPLIEEPNSPPVHDLLAHVSVSTVPSWEDYARWERALLTEAFQDSSDLSALAQKLTAGATTPRQKLERLTAYAAQEVRYQQDYETTIAGVRPHSCRQVLERGYGDCKDKAVLLISLAKAVGIKLEYALLRTKPAGEVERDIPNQQFNHAITYVPVQPGFATPFFVDATTDGLDVGNLRADDQGATSLVLDPDQKEGFSFVQIPYRTPDEQFNRTQVQLTVDTDGKVSARNQLVVRGNEGSAIRRILKNPGYARKFDEQLAAYLFPASTLAGAEAGDPTDVWHPISLTLNIDASNSLEDQGTIKRLRLPTLPGLDRLGALATRKSPLWMGVPETVETHLTVKLPASAKLLAVPADFEETPRCLAISRRSVRRGTELEMHLSLVRTCPEVSPAEYPAFRASLLRAVSRLQDTLAFGTTGKALPVKAARE